MRGHTRKLPALKRLHGSNKPMNPDEPMPEGNLSEEAAESAPAHFSPAQREIWENTLKNCPPDLIKRLDTGILEAYVVALNLHRRAVKEMGDGELTYAKGSLEFNSALIQIISKQGELVRKHGNELGFSPISRPRILADTSKTPALASSITNLNRAHPKDPPRQSLESYLANAPKTVN